MTHPKRPHADPLFATPVTVRRAERVFPWLVLLQLTACGAPPKRAEPLAPLPRSAALAPGDVVVVPVLGRDHLRSKAWSVTVVVELVAALSPDVVLLDVSTDDLVVALGPDVAPSSATLRTPEPALIDLAQRRPEVVPLAATARVLGAELVAYSAFDAAGREAIEQFRRQNPFGRGDRETLLAQAAWHHAWLGGDAPNSLEFLLGDESNELGEQASRWLSSSAEELLGPVGELRGLAREMAVVEDVLAADDSASVVILVQVDRRWYFEQAIDARFDGRRVDLAPLLQDASR